MQVPEAPSENVCLILSADGEQLNDLTPLETSEFRFTVADETHWKGQRDIYFYEIQQLRVIGIDC